MKLSYNGKVSNTGLKIYNRGQFDSDINMFMDKEITLTIERKKKKRSIDQNSYYWGVVVKIVRDGLIDAGYRVGVEQTHELLKDKFADVELVNETTGEVIHTKQSTSVMTTTEFMGFIAAIQQWGAEYLNIQIPDPNEQLTIEI